MTFDASRGLHQAARRTRHPGCDRVGGATPCSAFESRGKARCAATAYRCVAALSSSASRPHPVTGTSRLEPADRPSWRRARQGALASHGAGLQPARLRRGFPARAHANLLTPHDNAFVHFGGRCERLLCDHKRTVVLGTTSDADGHKVHEPNDTFHAFARLWGLTPRLPLTRVEGQSAEPAQPGQRQAHPPHPRELQAERQPTCLARPVSAGGEFWDEPGHPADAPGQTASPTQATQAMRTERTVLRQRSK